MSMKKQDINCPNCNHKNRFKYSDIYSLEKIDDIINQKIFKLKCKKCNQETIIDFPFIIEDENVLIYYVKNIDESIKSQNKSIMRLCNNMDDLKELLLIIKYNLNDIIIHFIKSYLIDNLNDGNIELRFNRISDDLLIFSIIGSKRTIGFEKNKYDDLSKKFKIKKIKKCVLIDNNNYKKYYRWRLLK